MRKNDFNRFAKRNVHKRKKKEDAKAALLRAIKECGFSTDGVKVKGSFDEGRRARASFKKRNDEVLAEGVFSSSKSGFGFVKVEGIERDIFIPEDKTASALDGDLVEIIYHSFTDRFGSEKTEGRVKRIIEYGRRSVIGTVCERRIRHGRRVYVSRYVLPDDARLSMRPDINEDGGARLGDKVEALIKRGNGEPECDVIRVFGDSESREANYEAILSEEGIVVDFTPEELSEAERMAAIPVSPENRVDRRDETIFTIDGESAKDLDDAVSVRRMPGGGYRLGVHIADVSHYVLEKTALDRAVMARGTSVYFTDKVVPMLPKALSNGACSLNPGEDKYALSAIIDLDCEANILGAKIEESIINSKCRGVYSEINAIFEGNADKEIKTKYKPLARAIEVMRELYLKLLEKSKKRGAIDFDAPEAQILLGEDGMPIEICRRERGEAERIIEQFMLTANEAVATLLYNEEIPCVYRIHEAPPPDKLSDFVDYMHNLGFDTSVITKKEADSRAFSHLLSLARERDLLLPVSYTMLRTMSKAQYSEEKKPHFGLGIENYCHFTSPIRRLSDLATHRIIKRALLGDKEAKRYNSYAKRAAAAATEAELRAVSAERRIDNLYKTLYMKNREGDSFDAVITSVTSFGLFAELENTCEGLIPISELPGMCFFDEKNLTVRSSDAVWRIGDKIVVTLEEADVIRGKLRFSLTV